MLYMFACISVRSSASTYHTRCHLLLRTALGVMNDMSHLNNLFERIACMSSTYVMIALQFVEFIKFMVGTVSWVRWSPGWDGPLGGRVPWVGGSPG